MKERMMDNYQYQPLVKNPEFGFERGYSSKFKAKDTVETLEGLLTELHALKMEGFEVVDIRIENRYNGDYHLIAIVRNNDMYIK